MKKTAFYLALIVGIVIGFSAATGKPAQAQEDLNTILARAATKSFLTTLSRPDLSDALQFYVVDGLRIEGMLNELGEVSDYEITRAGWLKPGETYEVEALLQPNGQTVIVHSGKYNSRWKVDGVELSTPTAGGEAVTTAVAVGPRPVVGNGPGKLVFQTQNAGDIYVVNADGTGLQRVTHGIDPQLSPDGTQITFTRWAPEYQIFTINVDGTNERGWFGSRRQMKSPAWSADGSRLTFNYQNGGRLNPEHTRVSLSTLAKRAAKGQAPHQHSRQCPWRKSGRRLSGIHHSGRCPLVAGRDQPE